MFFIVWRGWGIVVPLISGFALGLGTFVAVTLTHDPRIEDFIIGAVVVAAGVGTWFLGRRINADPGRELVDPKTGEMVTLRRRHEFFFVPVQWWSLVIGAFGLYFIAYGIARPTS